VATPASALWCPLIKIEMAGLEECTELVEMMRSFGASAVGAAFLGTRRSGKVGNNKQLLDYLATEVTYPNGYTKPARDIRPNEEDIRKAHIVFRERIINRLRTVTRRNPGFTSLRSTTIFRSGRVKREAENILVSALRASCKTVVEAMATRIAIEDDNAGNKLQQVEPRYAKRRESKYGVSKDVVLFATGSLFANLAKGTIRVYKGLMLFS
jgi:hypothetical protein